MLDLTPAERAVLAYLVAAIEAGGTPVMRDIAASFYWLTIDELHDIINDSLYEKGYIDFRLDQTPSLVIRRNPFQRGTASV